MATEHYAVYSLKSWRFLVSITIVRSIYSKDDTPLLVANVFYLQAASHASRRCGLLLLTSHVRVLCVGPTQVSPVTRSSAIAEGPRDALVS